MELRVLNCKANGKSTSTTGGTALSARSHTTLRVVRAIQIAAAQAPARRYPCTAGLQHNQSCIRVSADTDSARLSLSRSDRPGGTTGERPGLRRLGSRL